MNFACAMQLRHRYLFLRLYGAPVAGLSFAQRIVENSCWQWILLQIPAEARLR